MSHFQPARASPLNIPSHTSRRPPSRLDLTTSTATSVSSEALSGLTQEDVQVIDEIIGRAPASTTTFLNVFKAYNEVLQERGLDSGNDVVYYKMLLKIGVVRGSDWGTKWAAVKEQYGYAGEHRSSVSDAGKDAVSAPSTVMRHGKISNGTRPAGRKTFLAPARVARRDRRPMSDDMSDSERTSSPRTLVQRPTLKDFLQRAPVSDGTQSELHMPSISEFVPVHARARPNSQSQASSSVVSAEIIPHVSSRTERPSPASISSVLPARRIGVSASPLVRKQMNPRPSIPATKNALVNTEDAWKKIRLDMDEKYADDIYEEHLVDRHFLSWHGKLLQIQSMLERADDFRQRALLKKAYVNWRSMTLSLWQRGLRLERIADLYSQKRVFTAWRKSLSLKRVQVWKTDMKERFRRFRKLQQRRILKQYLTLWRLQFQLRFAEQLYEHNLGCRMMKDWQGKLHAIRQREIQATEFLERYDELKLSSFYVMWREQFDLRVREKLVVGKLKQRMLQQCMEKWISVWNDVDKTEGFYDKMLTRRFFRRWKASKARLKAMADKADKQKRRGDKVLVRVLLRIWIAKERGNLLLNVKSARMLQATYAFWRQRTLECDAMTIRAQQFEARPSSQLLTSMLAHWHTAYQQKQRAYLCAVEYDKRRFLVYWQIKLRQKLELVRRAKFARKYLLLCNAWKMWVHKLDENRRQAKLQALESKLLRKYFTRWQQISRREQFHRLALQKFKIAHDRHLTEKTLDAWINLTLEIKDREFKCVEARQNKILLKCYQKWKETWKITNLRHIEELSLMQSYQDIKREETLRRMFLKWQTEFKKARYLRNKLQEHELQIVADSWDRWQEKLQAVRLKPLEDALMVHNDANRLYHAFVLWHSKTKSTLAVRFFAANMKLKYWNAWRNAMPKALQAKKARERYNHTLQASALDKWAKAYRTKIALKAVARARFLRLPSGLPRQQTSLVNSVTSIAAPLAFPNSVASRLRSRERPVTPASSTLDDRLTRTGSRHSQYESEADDDSVDGHVRETASAPSVAGGTSSVWAQLRRTRLARERR